ncbi:MAG: LysR family transcriptional regulator [Pseudomonadota bacterium]
MSLPRKLDLNLLRVFDVLMEERNVTQAARRLNMSQPSCSNALERLRNALDDRILERQGHNMVPSRFAEAFWPRVRQSLSDLGAGLTELQTFSPEAITGHLRIGMDPYSNAAFGARISSRLLNEAPNARISILPIDVNNIEGAASHLDIIIGTIWSEQAGIEKEEVLEEEVVVVRGRGRLEKTGAAPLDLEAYVNARHLLLSDKGIVPGYVDAALKALSKTRQTYLAAPHYQTLSSVLKDTDCVATIGRSLAVQLAPQDGLEIFEPPLFLNPFTIGCAWYGREAKSQQLMWLRQLCRRVLQPGKT